MRWKLYAELGLTYPGADDCLVSLLERPLVI
jgi:hypothetical protein